MRRVRVRRVRMRRVRVRLVRGIPLPALHHRFEAFTEQLGCLVVPFLCLGPDGNLILYVLESHVHVLAVCVPLLFLLVYQQPFFDTFEVAYQLLGLLSCSLRLVFDLPLHRLEFVISDQ